jgi:hypothetical protein
VLLGEQGGRHQHRHLAPGHHRLEGRAQGNLGFAVAHVAADQAVHWPGGFHVTLDGLNSLKLIFRLDVREGSFQFLLPGSIGRERDSLGGLSPSVQIEQFASDVFDGMARPVARLPPFRCAQARKRRRMLIRADVSREAIHLMHRHENLISPGKLHLQVLARGALHHAAHQAGESPNAVFDMHHEIVGMQIGIFGLRRQRRGARSPPRFRTHPTEDLSVAQ